MTDLTTARPTSKTAAAPVPIPEPAVTEQTLITEQQVLFGTAAARAPVADSRESAPGYYPKRYTYLENALMAREMHRL